MPPVNRDVERQIVQKALQRGMSEDQIKQAVTAYRSQAQPQAAQPQPQQQQSSPNFFQGLVQGIAKPFLKTATNALNFGEGVSRLVQGDVQGANEAATKARDFGYFGKDIRPVGVDDKGEFKDVGGFTKDVIGTGLEIGSYAAPTAIGTGAKVLGAGGKVAPAVGALAKGGALAGTLGSTGAALQEDKTLGQVAGAGATGALLGTGLSVAAPLFGKAVGKVSKGMTKGAKVQRVVDANYKALTELEDAYAPLRKAVSKEGQRGIDPKRIIADTDWLLGSVDDTGTIRTLGEGGAVEQAREFIKPMEDVVSANLKREGKSVPLDVIKRRMEDAVNASDIKGADKANALAKVAKEIEGLALESNGLGEVPVWVIHDAKRYKYANIDYLNPGSKNTDKLVAKALKDIVEETTESVDVKAINRELADYYSALSFLEKLDGRKVKGGKLGKYFAQTIGAIVGSHVGGPIGAVVGAETGGRIRGAMMKSTFSKASGMVPKQSGLMEDAVRLGKTPPKPLLGLPAPDPSKSGPTIRLGGPTTYEKPAKVVGGVGQKNIVDTKAYELDKGGVLKALRGSTNAKKFDSIDQFIGEYVENKGGVKYIDPGFYRSFTDFLADTEKLNIAKIGQDKYFREKLMDTAADIWDGRTPKDSSMSLDSLIDAYKKSEVSGFSKKFYHGTNKKFDSFSGELGGSNSKTGAAKNHIFFTNKPDVAKSYGKNIVEAYMDLKNPLVIDAKESGWDAVEFDGVIKNINEVAKDAEKSGYDGLIVKNVRDTGGSSDGKPAGFTSSDTIVVFNKDNVKIAN